MLRCSRVKFIFSILFILCFFYLLIFYYTFFSNFEDDDFNINIYYQPRKLYTKFESCTFETCFDLSKCKKPSLIYSKFLSILRKLPYTTTNASEACLFILSIDTIDRDRISENYVKDIDAQISNLPKDIWNDDHNLGFNYSKAMIARSSFSASKLRYNFDMSFPLFHPDHTFTKYEAMNEKLKMKRIEAEDKYFVSFKGKRYVYGIGSETRDSLHHLHNGHNIIMATTCKHNNDWKKFEDSRCEKDNEMYDQYDYNDLLRNSTFCLTPRGRRLASFRFLEALKAGCIPVILSDDWVLPFSEIINWDNGVVYTPENMTFLLINQLGKLTYGKVEEMKRFGQQVYWKYLSNYESIIETSINIVFERVRTLQKKLLSKLN